MAEEFDVVIIGAGPAGLSAAANAAHHGLSHLLIEKSEIGNTIFDYQLRKHVMAEPTKLPLRSLIGFEAGSREKVLELWNRGVDSYGIRVLKAEVQGIAKQEDGTFSISHSSGSCKALRVVLCIGVQGTPRKLGVPGEDLPLVTYTLSDPEAFSNSDILIVGAGDAAIENALALCEKNRVALLNRSDEFPRAKDANVTAIQTAIKAGKIRGFFSAQLVKIETNSVTILTPEGEIKTPCDRIIARIGSVMPRRFIESCGIRFPNDDINSVPVVNKHYESNVDGLYILGALIGYPLIKQAMNQGYEVIEHLIGNEVEPADQVLIAETLDVLGGETSEQLEMIRSNLPLFHGLSEPQNRELIIDSTVHIRRPGDVIFFRNDYTDTFFSVVKGKVEIELPGGKSISISQGGYFGEMGLLSGRRRSATVRMVEDGILLETPRKQILKLINSVESVKHLIDRRFMQNALETRIFPEVDPSFISELVKTAHSKSFKKGEVLFSEGEPGDVLYVIRKGSVKVSRRNKLGNDVAQTYLSAGNYVGEMALLKKEEVARSATVVAAVPCETIIISKEQFLAVLEKNSEARSRIIQLAEERTLENLTSQRDEYSAGMLDFMVQQGVTDAENVLIIDSDVCVGCDNCESACAATHGGYSRLDRKGGCSFASLQVPISCRHCENPLCMLDCPPDALLRKSDGEVIIQDSCIGCGNCVRNCPYGVIQMVYDKGEKGAFSLLKTLLGLKNGGAEQKGIGKAGKCDMCGDLEAGPACVRACPTGAALRVNPRTLLELISKKGERKHGS